MKHLALFLGTIIILIAACSNQDDTAKSVSGGNSHPTPATTATIIDNSKRFALLIGNADYQHAPSLDNPVNDAVDMATTLKSLGFQVIVKRNANKRTMVEAVQTFGTRLSHGGVGLFYFSGHGLQSNNRNYLVPTDAKINSEADIEFDGFDANRVLAQMGQANNGLNLMILDACRDNPYRTTTLKGLKKGLATMNSPPRTLIAYATAPDRASYGDSQQRNSIYTTYLLAALRDNRQVSMSVLDMLTGVAKKVVTDTQGKQVPWKSDSLLERFCFGKCVEPPPPPPLPPPPPSGPAERQPTISPEVSRLLRECEKHFQANRLTTGKGGTAFACYRTVLEKEPNNAEAWAGLEKIEARYVTWINKALDSGQSDKAKQYLASLRKVNPNSPKLAEFDARISMLTSKVDFAALFKPKQGRFETTPEFQARRKQLLAQFNQAVQQRDLRYQAGVAYLKDYDADAEKLSVSFKWQAAWVKQFLGSLHKNKHGTVKIAPRDAQALWQTGQQKPLFVKVQMVENSIKSEGALVENGQVWTVSLDRYIDNGNGSVTDLRTGLIWLKNANCFGRQKWKMAMQSAANLASGQCGLSDDSRRGRWRLPTKDEWEAMVDKKYEEPALSNAAGTGHWKEGDAFVGVKSKRFDSWYWASSTRASYAGYAWGVNLGNGNVDNFVKSYTLYVWPVRGGH